jgi:hypothetical protein
MIAGLENKIISLQQKLTEAKEENKQLRAQVSSFNSNSHGQRGE